MSIVLPGTKQYRRMLGNDWLWSPKRNRRRPPRRDYPAYLESSLWKNRRDRFLERHTVCFVCGLPPPLDVHHLTYSRIGYERDSDLVALCRLHHQKVHYNQKSGKKIPFNSRVMKRRLEYLVAVTGRA